MSTDTVIRKNVYDLRRDDRVTIDTITAMPFIAIWLYDDGIRDRYRLICRTSAGGKHVFYSIGDSQYLWKFSHSYYMEHPIDQAEYTRTI